MLHLVPGLSKTRLVLVPGWYFEPNNNTLVLTYNFYLLDRKSSPTCSIVHPFNLHILSDHRGIFMDLSTSQCFGSSITSLQPHSIRDLSTKRSHQIAPYLDDKYRHLQEHRWFQKLEHLERHLRDGTIDHALAKDMYDRLIASSLLAGSKLTNHFMPQKHPATPEANSYQKENIKRYVQKHLMH